MKTEMFPVCCLNCRKTVFTIMGNDKAIIILCAFCGYAVNLPSFETSEGKYTSEILDISKRTGKPTGTCILKLTPTCQLHLINGNLILREK